MFDESIWASNNDNNKGDDNGEHNDNSEHNGKHNRKGEHNDNGEHNSDGNNNGPSNYVIFDDDGHNPYNESVTYDDFGINDINYSTDANIPDSDMTDIFSQISQIKADKTPEVPAPTHANKSSSLPANSFKDPLRRIKKETKHGPMSEQEKKNQRVKDCRERKKIQKNLETARKEELTMDNMKMETNVKCMQSQLSFMKELIRAFKQAQPKIN